MALSPAQQIALQRQTGGGVIQPPQEEPPAETTYQVEEEQPQVREFSQKELKELQKIGLGRLGGDIERKLLERGYTESEVLYLTGQYSPKLRVYGASRKEQEQIATIGKLRAGGLSQEEAKEVATTQQISYEQAMKLPPQTREALGIKFPVTSGFEGVKREQEIKAQAQRIENYKTLVGEVSALGLQWYPPETPASITGEPYSQTAFLRAGGFEMKERTGIQRVRDVYFSKVQEGVLFMAEGSAGVVSLGGLLDRKKEFNMGTLVPVTSKTGEQSTISYEFKALTPEQKYFRGDITREEYVKQASAAEYCSSFFKGVSFGVISAVAPPIGLVLGASSLGGAYVKRQEIVSQFKIAPLQSTGNILAGFGGVVVGGIGTTAVVRGIKSVAGSFGKEYIPPEKIVTQRVLSGEKKFPEAPTGKPYSAKLRLEWFKRSPYRLPGETQQGMWHTSVYTFAKTTKTTKGASEVAGLYGAPSASTYFLKLGKDVKTFGLSMESVVAESPSILRIYPSKFAIASLSKVSRVKPYYVVSGGKQGVAYVLDIKPEIEAVIPPNTPLVQTGASYFTKIDGVNVPIFQYAVQEGGVSASIISEGIGGYSPFPVVTPSSASYSLSSVGLVPSISVPSISAPSSVGSISPSVTSITSSAKSLPSIKSSVYLPVPSKSSFKSSAKSYLTSLVSPSVSITSSKVSLPSYKPSPSYKPPTSTTTSLIPQQSSLVQKARKILEGKAYKTYVYRFGKKQYLSGISPRKEAILKGEKVTLRTLAARFGIEETKIGIKSPETRYTPSERLFRGYQIRGKARIPLKDEWIQKAGTKREPTIKGARLGSRSEVSELMSFKRKKGGSFFGL